MHGPDVLGGDRVVEGLSQRAGEVAERPVVRVRHGDEAEVLAQAFERIDAVGKRGPARDRSADRIGVAVARRQSELSGHRAVGGRQHGYERQARRALVLEALGPAEALEDRLVVDGAAGLFRDRADGGGDTRLEIDERAD